MNSANTKKPKGTTEDKKIKSTILLLNDNKNKLNYIITLNKCIDRIYKLDIEDITKNEITKELEIVGIERFSKSRL